MTFNDIKNNDFLIEKISASIACGNISHAYIFEAGPGESKRTIADSFAKALLCGEHPGTGCDSCVTCKKIDHGNHEDIIYIEKDETSVKDEAIEELQERLKRKPYGGDRSIAVIMDADTMTDRAQNRLLKTLEEPFPGTVIVLLSENSLNLKKTVQSRCAVLRWEPFSDGGLGDLKAEAEQLVKAISEREPFYLLKAKLTELSGTRDNALKLLDAMETALGGCLRRRLSGGAAVYQAVWCIEEARRELKRGANTGYTLRSMMLKMEDKRW